MAPVPEETPVARRRASNDRIADAAVAHRFDAQTPVPFICECTSLECGELLRLTIEDLRAARRLGSTVIAPGHAEPGPTVRPQQGYWLAD